MRKGILIIGLLFFGLLMANELKNLATIPTAGILQKGEAEINGKLFKNDGFLLETKIGLLRYFMFGISFSGENIVGNQEPKWQSIAGFMAKYRFIDETEKNPAIVLGFNNQGAGTYKEDFKRYEYKSKGIYIVGSKNYLWLGNLGLTLGANYSFENDIDKDFDIFLGFDKTIGEQFILLGDYSIGINDYESSIKDEDKTKNAIGRGRGYLDFGLQFNMTENISFRIIINDIFENLPTFDMNRGQLNRELYLNYYFKF